MATTKQVGAAKRNIRKAQAAATRAKTISKLPRAVRRDLSRNAAAARRRRGRPGHRLEDRTRAQLYEVAKERKIPGRSSMGKQDLIRALRRS